MSDELETAAAMSLGGLSKSEQDGSVEGEPCRNCETLTVGKYCHACGQLAQNFHRPIFGLTAEALGDFFSLDGRIARTIPALLFIPGRVTRHYLDGKRQRYVPPFRLYLLASFIFFLVLFSLGDATGWFQPHAAGSEEIAVTDTEAEPEETEESRSSDTGNEDEAEGAGSSRQAEADGKVGIAVLDPDKGPVLVSPEGEVSDLPRDEGGRIDQDALLQEVIRQSGYTDEDDAELRELMANGVELLENRVLLYMAVRNWAPRLAFMLAPMLVLCLILVFPFRKGVYIYDHVITALHFQTWLYFLMSVCLTLLWLHQIWVWWLIFIGPLVYLYRMLRRVYSTGRVTGFLRACLILFMLNFALLAWGVVVFALSVNETVEISRVQ